jgi:hypothetical protein
MPGFRISVKKDKDAELSDFSDLMKRQSSKCPISVKNDKIEIPVQFFRPPMMPPERIDQFLAPEFVSLLAAKLWRGDDEVSVNDALALIEACAKALAWRKFPLSGITLSGNPPPGSFRQWERFPLKVVIDIAAMIGRWQKPDNAAKRAISLIETAMLKKNSEENAGKHQKEPAGLPSNQPSRRHLGSGLAKAFKFEWGWKEAAKRITATERSGRATERLPIFLNDLLKSKESRDELKHAIADREKNGFTLPEVLELRRLYADWQAVYLKSRQSESGKKIGRKKLSKKSA